MNPWLAKFQRALVLCAHTDDEYGCAGTIVRLLQAGVEVRYVALSRCEASVPPPYAEDILESECRRCTAALGIQANLVEVLRYPVRHFPAQRQEILEYLVQLRREYAPELVLLPSSFDTHQDHATVYAEGFRAFKHSSILGYELPQNLISFDNTAFVKLTEITLQKKIEALAHYQSQRFRNYSAQDFIRSLAYVRGTQCNSDTQFAEAFEVVRLII